MSGALTFTLRPPTPRAAGARRRLNPTVMNQDLYKQIVMEHSRRPRHFGVLAGATAQAEGINPGCGDRVEVQVRLDGDTLAEVNFTGRGCAISVASASLMTGLVRGKTVTQALALADAFSEMLRTGQAPPELGDSAALSGVHSLHTRVKCAALGWQTLRAALTGPAAGHMDTLPT